MACRCAVLQELKDLAREVWLLLKLAFILACVRGIVEQLGSVPRANIKGGDNVFDYIENLMVVAS